MCFRTQNPVDLAFRVGCYPGLALWLVGEISYLLNSFDTPLIGSLRNGGDCCWAFPFQWPSKLGRMVFLWLCAWAQICSSHSAGPAWPGDHWALWLGTAEGTVKPWKLYNYLIFVPCRSSCQKHSKTDFGYMDPIKATSCLHSRPRWNGENVQVLHLSLTNINPIVITCHNMS